jgi:pyrroline-5-carboxylate reductase
VNPDAIAFIGAGQMARALIAGLLREGRAPASLVAADPVQESRAALGAFADVASFADNADAAGRAATWVLAVKPQQLKDVATQLAPLAQRAPLVISVAAGITLAQLRAWLGDSPGLVRAMPNRPAFIGAGVTALYAAPGLPVAARAIADRLFAAVGISVWLEEERQMDAVTAISGSGPAYFFRLIELLERAAIDEGLPPAMARLLAVETAKGAGLLAAQGSFSPGELRAQVTSPGGTTAAALAVLETGGLSAIVSRAVAAARARAEELARTTGGERGGG